MLALDHNDTVTSCHMGLSPQHHYHLLGAHGFPNTRAPHLSLNPYRCSHSKIWYYMHTWPVTKLGLSYPSWVSESPSVVSDSLQPHGLYSPWNSPGQNTGVGSLSFLQGIFPTQGSNPAVPHCRWILYQLSHKGSPRVLEWVAYLFSSRSSWPRNHTEVSCIAGGFFTNWAIREFP